MKHVVVLSLDELFKILGQEAVIRLGLSSGHRDIQLRCDVRDGLLFAIEVHLSA